MTHKPSVAVVIPNWNGQDLIADCVRSLQSQIVPVHIIVVDNGSADQSLALLQREFPTVQLVALPKNLGFAGGVNAGIREALAGEYTFIALFNNDAIADTHWSEQLVKTLDQHPRAGIATGKFMALDKKHFDSTGERFHRWGVPSPRGRYELDEGQYDKTERVFGATGGASLYRAALFQRIGLFDEAYFMYCEDADISFRAQLAGWDIYYQPRAVAYHHIGASTGRVKGLHAYHTMKNEPMLVWKNVPARLLPGILVRFSFLYAINFLAMVRTGNAWPALRGIGAAIALWPHALIERHGIQSHRRVSTDYIRSIITPDLPPGVSKLERIFSKGESHG